MKSNVLATISAIAIFGAVVMWSESDQSRSVVDMTTISSKADLITTEVKTAVVESETRIIEDIKENTSALRDLISVVKAQQEKQPDPDPSSRELAKKIAADLEFNEEWIPTALEQANNQGIDLREEFDRLYDAILEAACNCESPAKVTQAAVDQGYYIIKWRVYPCTPCDNWDRNEAAKVKAAGIRVVEKNVTDAVKNAENVALGSKWGVTTVPHFHIVNENTGEPCCSLKGYWTGEKLIERLQKCGIRTAVVEPPKVPIQVQDRLTTPIGSSFSSDPMATMGNQAKWRSSGGFQNVKGHTSKKLYYIPRRARVRRIMTRVAPSPWLQDGDLGPHNYGCEYEKVVGAHQDGAVAVALHVVNGESKCVRTRMKMDGEWEAYEDWLAEKPPGYLAPANCVDCHNDIGKHWNNPEFAHLNHKEGYGWVPGLEPGGFVRDPVLTSSLKDGHGTLVINKELADVVAGQRHSDRALSL